MGIVLEKDILEQLYCEYPDINKKDLKAIIDLANKRMLMALNKDMDVAINGDNKDYDGFFMCSMIYGDISYQKKKLQKRKLQNRNRVNRFLNKKKNEQTNQA